MLADTPLVKNLENEEYVKIILNGRASLAELFSEIDANVIAGGPVDGTESADGHLQKWFSG
jgi:hypothetical protein